MQCILVKSDELENSCPLLHDIFLNPRYARSVAIIYGKDGRKNMARKPCSQHSYLELRESVLRSSLCLRANDGRLTFVNSFEKKFKRLSCLIVNERHATNLRSSPPTLSSIVCEWISLPHLSLEDHSLSRDTKRAFLTPHNIMSTFRDVITKAEFLLSYFQHLSIGRCLNPVITARQTRQCSTN